MTSIIGNFFIPPCFRLGSVPKKNRPVVIIGCLGGSELSVLSSDSVSVNGVSSVAPQQQDVVRDGSFKEEKKSGGKAVVAPVRKLEPLWDDGYGSQTVKDYLDLAKDIIKPDGGPPRWFCPVLDGGPLADSPVLLFLPGMDGLGLGLILHEKSLGRLLCLQSF